MVLTVTFNPLLEQRLYFKNVVFPGENRSDKEEFKSGGKGINVSRQLNHLGIKNLALTFIGGSNGKIFRSLLEEENIDFTPVSAKANLRTSTIVIDESNRCISSFFSPDSEIQQKELDEFKSKLEKTIKNSSLVVFSGSVPTTDAAAVLYEGIEMANREDKPVVLDTYGKHLVECLKLSPLAVHNTIDEINHSLHKSINDEKEILDFLDELYNYGVKLAFLTNGDKTFYSSKYDFKYKITPPKVDTIDATGSGDAFTAGIIHGLERSLVYEEMLANATALGALNALNLDAANVVKEDMENLVDKVKIEPVGKKMKLIDDSPNY